MRSIETLINIQEKARFITTILSDRIHRAGDRSCVDLSNPVDRKWAIKGNTSELMISECLHYQGRDQFVRMLYFIGNTHRENKQGKPIYALYQKPTGGRREELISGVKQLKIEYGIASNNAKAIERYSSSDSIRNWNKIRSVSICLYFDSLKKPWHIYSALRERA